MSTLEMLMMSQMKLLEKVYTGIALRLAMQRESWQYENKEGKSMWIQSVYTISGEYTISDGGQQAAHKILGPYCTFHAQVEEVKSENESSSSPVGTAL